MKKFITLAALLLTVILSCSFVILSEAKNLNEQNAKTMNQSKSIVVFFSHTGENYSVGNIKIGNTKRIADYISAYTGAEQFDVVAQKSYDMSYNDLIELAKVEIRNNEYVAYKGDIDLSGYDTIFIGGPVWWGVFPNVLNSFLKDHSDQLKNKTIAVFTTHEGSGLGSCEADTMTMFPSATFLDGYECAGHNAASAQARTEKWLKKIGF